LSHSSKPSSSPLIYSTYTCNRQNKRKKYKKTYKYVK
jgi:hypothetical protein